MKKVFVLTVCLLSAMGACAQNQAEQDDATVRSAYGTFSFLCGLPAVVDSADKQRIGEFRGKILMDAEIQKLTPVFELSQFRNGDLKEIEQSPWQEFVSLPEEDKIIRAFQSTFQITKGGKEFDVVDYRAFWKNGIKLPEEDKAIAAGFTVKEAIEELALPKEFHLARYVSYLVSVEFDGRKAGPYRAMFLFGTQNGKEVILPFDPNGGGGILQEIVEGDFHPSGLFQSELGSQPVLKAWLCENRIPENSCSRARTDLCCLGSHCSVRQSLADKELAQR